MKIAALLVWLLCLPCITHAQSSEGLKKITGISLSVTVSKSLIDAGADKDAIRTSVELKLRNMGLVVVDGDKASAASDIAAQPKIKWASVYVDCDGFKVEDTALICYSLNMSGSEWAFLILSPEKPLNVTIWEKASFGCFGTSRPEVVKRGVDDMADSFCNDYLTANPKPSPVAPDPPK